MEIEKNSCWGDGFRENVLARRNINKDGVLTRMNQTRWVLKQEGFRTRRSFSERMSPRARESSCGRVLGLHV